MEFYSACIKEDKHITAYRDHAHPIALGVHPKYMVAELYGKKTGMSKGKGGSMHMFSPKIRFLWWSWNCWSSSSFRSWLAFAHNYRKEKKISRIYLGDGAMNNGQVFESFNLASLWNLPALFIIENNHYGMGTATKRSAAGGDLFERAKIFGIEGEKIDGMNFFTVSEAAIKARDYIIKENKPYVIEMDTYRFRGHSMSDPAKYRSKEEVLEKKEIDPVLTMRQALIKDYKITEAEIKDIETGIKKNIKETEQFALTSPLPELKELHTILL